MKIITNYSMEELWQVEEIKEDFARASQGFDEVEILLNKARENNELKGDICPWIRDLLNKAANISTELIDKVHSGDLPTIKYWLMECNLYLEMIINDIKRIYKV